MTDEFWVQAESNEQYRLNQGLSSSDFKLLLKSPAHYFARWSDPEETPDLLMGRLIHTMLFEPENAHHYYPYPKCDRRTKIGKSLYATHLAQAGNKTMIEDTIWKEAEDMTRGVISKLSQTLLKGELICEMSHYLRVEPELIYKTRPDCINITKGLLIDAKTTQDSSFKSFQSSIVRYGYHIQAAHYLDVCRVIYGKDFDFVWLVMEKEPPYGFRLFTPDTTLLEIGKTEINHAILRFKNCMATQKWPCYDDQVSTMTLPNWYVPEACYEGSL